MLANPAADSQVLSWDAIASADPDTIIVAACGYDVALAKQAVAEIKLEPDWAGLRAVRSERAWLIDGSAYVNRPGPRVVRSAELFAKAMHDNSFAPPIPFDGALVRA